MKGFLYKTIKCVAILPVLLFAACSNDKDMPDSGNKAPVHDVSLSINVSPLAAASDIPELEKLNSVRLVLVDKNGTVTFNEFRNISDEAEEINFSITTESGEYRLYAIGNETSVARYYTEEGSSLSDETLNERLSQYVPGKPGFDDFITSLNFSPDFSKPVVMSSYYKLNAEKSEEAFNVYLVNVATKIEINFYNYRNDPVEFSGVWLDCVSDRNYLMAKIDEQNQYVGSDYWITWLKKVSDDTTLHPDINDREDSNDMVNSRWGWFTKYSMPTDAQHSRHAFLQEEETWVVPKFQSPAQGAGAPDPGILKPGTFYLPESRYISSGSSQLYSMIFEIKLNNEEPKVFNKELGYLKSMFRQTHLMVNVEMNTAVEDLYVELIRWVESEPAYGTITPVQ